MNETTDLLDVFPGAPEIPVDQRKAKYGEPKARGFRDSQVDLAWLQQKIRQFAAANPMPVGVLAELVENALWDLLQRPKMVDVSPERDALLIKLMTTDDDVGRYGYEFGVSVDHVEQEVPSTSNPLNAKLYAIRRTVGFGTPTMERDGDGWILRYGMAARGATPAEAADEMINQILAAVRSRDAQFPRLRHHDIQTLEEAAG